MASVANLNARWRGRYVRTEDDTIAPSGHHDDPLEQGKPFGGEGVVERFYEEDGKVWLQVDWGFAWVIEPTTRITEVRASAAGPEGDGGKAMKS